jgi:hypothetical protein
MPLPSGSKTFKCADPNNQNTLTKGTEFAYANYGSIGTLCGFQFAQTSVDDASSISIRNWFQSAAQVVDNAASFGLLEGGSAGTPSYIKVVDDTDNSTKAVMKISYATGRKSIVTDNPGFVDAYNNNMVNRPTGFNGGNPTAPAPRVSVETGNFTQSTAVAASDNGRGDLVFGSTTFVPGRNYQFSWHATDPSPLPVWTAALAGNVYVENNRVSPMLTSNIDLRNHSVIVTNNADGSIMQNTSIFFNNSTNIYDINVYGLTPGITYNFTATVTGYQGSLAFSGTTLSTDPLPTPTFTVRATGGESAEVSITAPPTIPAGWVLNWYDIGMKEVVPGIADSVLYTIAQQLYPTAGQPISTTTIGGLQANKTYAFVIRAVYGPGEIEFAANTPVQYIYTASSPGSSPLSQILASAIPGNTQNVNGGAPAVSQLMKDMITEKAKVAAAGVFELVADTAGAVPPTPTEFISAMGKSGDLTASDYSQSYLSSPPLTAGGAVNGNAVVRPDMMNTASGAALLYAAKVGATYILRDGTTGVGQEIGRLLVGSDGSLSAKNATGQAIAGVTSGNITTYTVGNRTYAGVASGSLYIKVTGIPNASGITSTTTSIELTIAEQGTNVTPANGTVTAWVAKTAGVASGAAGTVAGVYNAGNITFSNLDANTQYYINVRTTGSGDLAETSWYTAPLLTATSKTTSSALLLWEPFNKSGNLTYAVKYNLVNSTPITSLSLTQLRQNGYDSGEVQQLTSGGWYRFQVVITDSQNNTYTTNYSYATLTADQGYIIPSSGTGNVQLNPPNGSTLYKYGTGSTQQQALVNMVTSANTYTGGQTVALSPSGDTYVAAGTFSAQNNTIVGIPTTQRVTNTQQNNPAICFLADAPVLTPAGYRPISAIAVGDLVRTAAGRDVAVKRVFAKEYEASASVNPFVIPKGSFGALRSLPISPNHEVMTEKGMVQAKNLGLKRMKMAGSFTYYNLELEDWVRDNLVVAGVECESLAPAKRVTMTKAEFGRFVKARYGPAAAARLRTVCFEEADGHVSMPAFA